MDSLFRFTIVKLMFEKTNSTDGVGNKMNKNSWPAMETIE